MFFVFKCISFQYGEFINRLYHRRGYFGNFARQFIRPPTVAYTYDKTLPGRPLRVPKQLPARISLRSLANHQFLVFAVVGLFTSKIFGYSAFVFTMFACFVTFLYYSLRALFQKCDHVPVENINLGNVSNESVTS